MVTTYTVDQKSVDLVIEEPRKVISLIPMISYYFRFSNRSETNLLLSGFNYVFYIVSNKGAAFKGSFFTFREPLIELSPRSAFMNEGCVILDFYTLKKIEEL